jgi:hypothetical protein
VCVLGVILLARGLRPSAFFAGDSGVKLIVARNAIEHPGRPLKIDLPRIGSHAVSFVDPFFRVSGGYAHAATPDLFPLLSAPLIALLGMRGAYVWPAVGFLGAIAAIAWIGIELDGRRSWTLGIATAAVCSPLLFYGLEFWEHAVAVGAAAAATALLVRNRNAPQRFASGALFAVSVLLRPEGACYAVAVAIAAPWLGKQLTRNNLAELAAGAITVSIPMVILSAISSDQILGSHITRNMSGIASQWLPTRFDYIQAWFAPLGLGWAAIAVLAMAFVAARRRSQTSGLPLIVILVGAMVCAVFAAAGRFERSSLWNVAPAVVAVTAIPLINRDRDGREFLALCAMVYTALVCLAAPSDGGAQWGPRYLLFAFIPVSILLTDVFVSAIRAHRTVGYCVTVIVIASALVDRNGYKQLRDAKQTYGRIIDFVDHRVPTGSYILTDVFWFGQVTASLYPTRTVLFVDTPATAASALNSLSSIGATIYMVQSSDEPSAGALRDLHLSDGDFRVAHDSIADRLITVDEFQIRR